MLKNIFIVSLVTLSAAAAYASDAPPLPACQCSVDVFQGAYGSQVQQANVHDLNRYSIYFKTKPLPANQGCYQLSCDTAVLTDASKYADGAVMSDLVNQLIAGDPVATSSIAQFGASHVQSLINSYLYAHATTYSPSAPVCQSHLSADGRRIFVGLAHIVKFSAKNYRCRNLAAANH